MCGSSPQIRDAGLTAIAHALRSNWSLTELSLVEVECRNKGVVALADALAGNTSLRRFSLRAPEIEVSAMIKLARVALAQEHDLSWECIGP